MPNEQTRKKITDLHKVFKAKGINKMIPILEKVGKKRVWFFDALKNPQKLSPIERQVFADEYGEKIEAIDWQDAATLIA